MKKMIKIVNNKYFFAFVFNIIVFLIFMFFSKKYYDMADTQVFAQQIAAGYYNIVFTNYFLCFICGLLQNLIYPINAYVIIELLLSFFAFYMLTIIFIEKYNKKIAMLILIIVFSFFGVNHYSTFSFTLTPALLGTSGFLALIHYINKEKKWATGAFLGAVLVLFSSMYRFEQFEAVLLCSGVFYIVYNVLNYFKNEKFHFSNLIKYVFYKKLIIVFVVIILATFGVNIISTTINTSTEELRYAKEYTSLRSAVWDCNYPSYYEAKYEYDNVGVSENDLLMLDKQYMDDEGAFNVDSLKNLVKITQEFKNKTKSPLSILLDMIHIEVADAIMAVTDKGLLLWAFLISLITFFVIQKKKQYAIPIILTLLVFSLYCYLWLKGRCLYRAIYGVVLSSTMYIFYSIDKQQISDLLRKQKKNYLYLASFVFVILISIIVTPLSSVSNLHKEYFVEKYNGYSDTLDYISNSNDKYVFTKGSMVLPIDTYENPFYVNVPEYLENSITFDGTYYRSKFSNDMLKEFGTNNLFKYLIDNPKVYLVDSKEVNYCSIIVTYLNEHYSNGKRIIANKEMSIEDYNFYKITTDK